MPPLSIIRSSQTELDLNLSRLTGLLVFGDSLIGTTRQDGQIVSWSLDSFNQQTLVEYQAPLSAGISPKLEQVGSWLLTRNSTDTELALYEIATDGSVTNSIDLDAGANFKDWTTIELAGETHVFGATIDGLKSFSFDAFGQPTGVTNRSTQSADLITAATVGSNSLLITATQTTNAIQTWRIETDGSLIMQNELTVDDGLWINTPSVLKTLSWNDATYLIVGSSGSSSLTVIELDTSGSMTLVDHLLDDRTLRFNGITTLETVTHDGQAYAIAGGADDGISVFQVLPNGQLLHRATLEDTDDATLTNPSDIAAKSTSNGIRIFVSSATEAGVTELLFDTTTLGMLIEGSTNDDAYIGTPQDDTLIDSVGLDTFTGGEGRDTFVMTADKAADRITDFDLGLDLIDLSAWPGLRDGSQLFLTQTANGLRIVYGDETLDIASNDGSPISTTQFAELGLQIHTRLGITPATGLSGPLTDDPDLPPRDIYIPPEQELASDEEGIERVGVAAADTLTGTEFADLIWGQGGDDTVHGNAGDDGLFGGSGSDALFGGAGDDFLSGGNGRDENWRLSDSEVSNADRLFGGAGNDQLYGFAGADVLSGGNGDDILVGGGGRDVFIFISGTDHTADFQLGVDRLEVSADLIQGIADASELVQSHASIQNGDLVFDFGNDTLTLEGFADIQRIASEIDII